MAKISCIDLPELEINLQSNVSNEKLTQFGQLLVNNFNEFGVVGLRGSGIKKQTVQKVLHVHEKFFSCSEEDRQRYASNENVHGYVVFNDRKTCEEDDPCKPDLNFNSRGASCEQDDPVQYAWPDDLSPGFSTIVKSFLHQIGDLSLVLLEAIALGLGLNKSFFAASHTPINSSKTLSTLDCIQIVPCPVSIKNWQRKNGYHGLCGRTMTAFGTLGLLFTAKDGGFQFQNFQSGKFVPVELDETVYVYVGDVLEVWTGKKLQSAVVRAVTVADGDGAIQTRENLIYYVCGDLNSVVCDLHLGQGKEEAIFNATTKNQMTVEKFIYKKLAGIKEDK